MSSHEVDVVTGEIVPVGPSTPALSFSYSPEQLGQWMASLQEYRRAILSDGPDFMVIPGTKKPSLLKPGAEKLLLAAGLGFTTQKIDDEDSRTHQGVTYKCTVHRGGQVVAECEGYAGFDEDRFYKSAVQAEADEKAMAARYQRKAKPEKFVEYRAPWNSVVKMSQKRAMVGATLNALAASGLFTQDLEDSGPAEVVPAPFDGLALLDPYLQKLTLDQRMALKDWREGASMPPPSRMDPQQTAAALVAIGHIMALAQPSEGPVEAALQTDQAQPDEGREPYPYDEPAF